MATVKRAYTAFATASRSYQPKPLLPWVDVNLVSDLLTNSTFRAQFLVKSNHILCNVYRKTLFSNHVTDKLHKKSQFLCLFGKQNMGVANIEKDRS